MNNINCENIVSSDTSVENNEVFKLSRSCEGAEYFYIEPIDKFYNARTFFTTRNGGVSTGSFDSLNMALIYNSPDNPDSLEENRRRVFSAVGDDGYSVVIPHQVHGDVVACPDRDLMAMSCREKQEMPLFTGRCREKEGAKRVPYGHCNVTYPDTDATITNEKNLILTSLHADCIPVWLYDPVTHTAGLAHAGWKGTRQDIAAKTMKRMTAEFGCKASDIIAVIGPGIDLCHFEVGPEVVESFKEMIGEGLEIVEPQAIVGGQEFVADGSMLPKAVSRLTSLGRALCIDDGNGKFHLDLKGINEYLLKRAGAGKIYISNYCTHCEEELFYSYRRDGGVTGRMCAGIVLI